MEIADDASTAIRSAVSGFHISSWIPTKKRLHQIVVNAMTNENAAQAVYILVGISQAVETHTLWNTKVRGLCGRRLHQRKEVQAGERVKELSGEKQKGDQLRVEGQREELVKARRRALEVPGSGNSAAVKVP
jgi:hypothetical protein